MTAHAIGRRPQLAATRRSTRAPAQAAHLRDLNEKIRASLRESDRRWLSVDAEGQPRGETFACQVGPRPMSDAAFLASLREALLAQKIVRFDYGDDDSARTRGHSVPACCSDRAITSSPA